MRIMITIPNDIAVSVVARALADIGVTCKADLRGGMIAVPINSPSVERHGNGNVVHIPLHRRQRAHPVNNGPSGAA